MKRFVIAAACLLLATSVNAGDMAPYRGDRNSSSSSSVSQSYSQSGASINQRDRAQAPGFGVGGGYCSDAASLSFPGGGFGFSSMSKVCKQEKLLGMADTYFGRPAARQVGCENVKEFRSLPSCVQARVNKAAAIQRRDRAKARN